MIVNIEEVIELLIQRKRLNKAKLSDIEFRRNGEKVEINQSIIDEWDFTGLSNLDFVGIKLMLKQEFNKIDNSK